MLRVPVPVVSLREPCHCGSGRKYKRCCWPRERREFAEALTEIREVPQIIIRFIGAPFQEVAEQTQRELIETAIDWTDEETLSQIRDDVKSMILSLGIESALVDVPAFGRRTAVETFLLSEESHALRLTTREYLEALNRSAFSLYEIEEVRGSEWIVLKDLLRKRRFELYDRTLPRKVKRLGVLFLRVVEMERLCLASNLGMGIKRHHLAMILEDLPEYKAALRARSLSWQRFFKREWTLPFTLWARMNLGPSGPSVLTNTEGDPLMLIDLEWKILPGKTAELRHRLDGARALMPENDSSWVLMGHGTGIFENGVLHAAIKLEGDILHVSVNSERREKEITVYLKELAGDCLGPGSREAVLVNPENLESLSRGKAASSEPAPDLPPEQEEQFLHRVLERHYTEWVHHSLPGLDGKTPTEAAADPVLRRKLVDILNMIEHHHATASPPMGTYDPSWLWKKLGLRRR